MSVNRQTLIEDLTSCHDMNLSDGTIVLSTEIDTNMVGDILNFYKIHKQLNPTIPATLILTCGGGDLFSTFAVIDMMEYYLSEHGIVTNVQVWGNAFSGAALIAGCATGTSLMSKNSFLMLHGVWDVTNEEEANIEKYKNIFDKLRDIMRNKLFLPEEEIEFILKSEIYYNAEQSIAKGLIDGYL